MSTKKYDPNFQISCQQGLEYTDCMPCKEVRLPKKAVSDDEAPLLYPFIAITPRSTLTWIGNTC